MPKVHSRRSARKLEKSQLLKQDGLIVSLLASVREHGGLYLAQLRENDYLEGVKRVGGSNGRKQRKARLMQLNSEKKNIYKVGRTKRGQSRDDEHLIPLETPVHFRVNFRKWKRASSDFSNVWAVTKFLLTSSPKNSATTETFALETAEKDFGARFTWKA
jgi:hypothetical protein